MGSRGVESVLKYGITGGGFRTGEDNAPGVFTIANRESDATVNGGEAAESSHHTNFVLNKLQK